MPPGSERIGGADLTASSAPADRPVWRPSFPHRRVIAVLSLLWVGLLGVTVWAWTLARREAAEGGPNVTLVWNEAAAGRFISRLEWAGLVVGVLLLAGLVAVVAVQEKARRRDE